MREPITQTIENKKFTFYALPFRKSRSVLFKVSKIIAPSLASGLSKNSKDMKDMKNLLDSEINLSELVNILFDRLDEEKVNYIFDTLLENVLCDGKKIGLPEDMSNLYDALFSGNLILYGKVVKAAFEAEYGDFFAERDVL